MFLAKVIVLCFAILTQCKSAPTDCLVPVSSFTDILPTDDLGQNILYPDNAGNIVTTNGVKITLACPGNKLADKKNKNTKFNYDYTQFECKNKVYVSTSTDQNLKKYKIDQLTCESIQPVEKIQPSIQPLPKFCDKNANSFRVVIGFQFKDTTFIPQIEVCWNDAKKTALYALATIKYIPNGWKAQAERPPFRTGQLIDKLVDLPYYYTQTLQMYTLWKSYYTTSIPPFLTPDIVGRSLLDRGHLVAKADFPYDVQQRLTFTYTNVGPQWGNFNKQNWEQIEGKIRNFVVTGKSDLSVYTGTSGILKINNKDYYIYEPKSQIPVPKYFWKIVLKQTGTTTLGVAILGLNDIFATTVTDPCKNVMSSVNWLKIPTANNVKSGYVIACEIKEFEKIPEMKGVLPTLPVSSAKIVLLK